MAVDELSRYGAERGFVHVGLAAAGACTARRRCVLKGSADNALCLSVRGPSCHPTKSMVFACSTTSPCGPPCETVHGLTRIL